MSDWGKLLTQHFERHHASAERILVNQNIIIDKLESLENKIDRLGNMEIEMSQMDDDIAALQASVTAENTVIDGAVSLINGIGARIQAAVDAALAAGASPAQLQAVVEVRDAINAKATDLGQAVAANTPTPPPTA